MSQHQTVASVNKLSSFRNIIVFLWLSITLYLRPVEVLIYRGELITQPDYMICTAVVLLVALIMTYKIGDYPDKHNVVFCFLLMVIPLTSLFFQSIFQQEIWDGRGFSSYLSARTIWFNFCVWLLLGLMLRITPDMCKAGIFILALNIYMIIWNLDTPLTLDYKSIAREMGGRYDHTMLDDVVAISFILSYVFNPRYKIIIYLLSIYELFCIGGRASLYISIITIVANEAIVNKRRGSKYFVSAISALSLVLTLIIIYNYMISSEYNLSEMFFIEGTMDGSFNQRKEQFEQSVRDLPDQFAFGYPSLIIKTTGSFGGYIHNIISAWQIFGFPFFTLLCYASYKSTKIIRQIYSVRAPLSRMQVFSVLLVIYSILSALLAKSIGAFTLPLALGLSLQNLWHIREYQYLKKHPPA